MAGLWEGNVILPCSTNVKNGRGGEIRTHDLYVPNVALYQAKLRPDYFSRTAVAAQLLKEPQQMRRRKQKNRVCRGYRWEFRARDKPKKRS